ncbi:MAG: VWA domain-containing protein [Acidobacteriia bacterium]|nr:VWA domain-containing protein [Terriglobia bacterium]
MRIRNAATHLVLLAALGVSGAAAQAPKPDNALKVKTRLITVDVVATDAHGHAIRDLQREDLQVFDGHSGEQKIVRMEFVDLSAASTALTAGAPALPAGPSAYSNLSLTRSQVAPTVMLMDALNTGTFNQVRVRRDMLLFLKSLPPDTPVAVFLLGHTVRVVQNFTSDLKLLQAAVDRAHSPSTFEQNPQDDPNSASNRLQGVSPSTPGEVVQALQDFEKTVYVEQTGQRVDETADAMKAIARFLGGYPGRKNLLWFSESFPLWIQPTSENGGNPAVSSNPTGVKLPGQEFSGAAVYQDKVRAAAHALSEARVAVYPVDARGLEGPQSYSAVNENSSTRRHPGGDIAAALQRESDERTMAQATMDELADETGGKTCKNTNSLAACVQRALDESSSYYELAYYPEDVTWDGSFHKIRIKSARHGVKLSYRGGYFATDTGPRAGHEPPQKLLQEACGDPLLSTSIGLTADALPSPNGSRDANEVRYLLTISPNALSFAPEGEARAVNLQMAICEYDPKGTSYQFYPRDLSRSVPEAVYQGWRQNGFRNIFDYQAKTQDQRLRFVVLDVPSGVAGSVDVPAHPHDFGSVPASLSSTVPGTPPAPKTGPMPVIIRLTFHSPAGGTSVLDWRNDKLLYQGDLTVGQGAHGFFQMYFEQPFHCEAGRLVPKYPSGTAPNFTFQFRSFAGPVALVDLNGNEPAYSGDLPVDASAKHFFDSLWKLCHCQEP